MPRDFPRSRRIADQVHRELSEIIRLELKDPRVGMITLTDVEVSPDGEHAKVYFSLLGGEDRIEEATNALRHASGFLRHELSQRMRLRAVPDLRFQYDTSVARGIQLSQLIDQAVASDSKPRKRRKR